MTKSEASAAQARCDGATHECLCGLPTCARCKADAEFDYQSRLDMPAALADRAALIEALKPLVRHWETCTIEVDDSGERAYDLLHEMGELEDK